MLLMTLYLSKSKELSLQGKKAIIRLKIGFFLSDALPGSYCSCLYFLLVPGVFCRQLCLQQWHAQLDSGQVTDLTIAEYSTSLPLNSIGLLSKCASGHCPSEALCDVI